MIVLLAIKPFLQAIDSPSAHGPSGGGCPHGPISAIGPSVSCRKSLECCRRRTIADYSAALRTVNQMDAAPAAWVFEFAILNDRVFGVPAANDDKRCPVLEPAHLLPQTNDVTGRAVSLSV